MRSKVSDWYQGTFKAYENDPGSALVFIGGRYERHWTSRAAHVAVEFYLREWKWVWGTLIALAGLAAALYKMG
jgi:hypothetical protein